MLCGYVTDQFLDQYSLTYTGTAEQTDLTTFCIRCKQVDNLNPGFQDFYNRALVFK